MEQKFTLLLSILLIVYNVPLNFYIEELFPNFLIIIISSFINILFYSFIIYFWMVIFEKIYLQQKAKIKDYNQSWKKIVFVLMIISGFLTYSSEALFFVNDPINIINDTHRPIFEIVEYLYNFTNILSFVYLMYITFKIQLSINSIKFEDKILFYFTLYFFFTINLFILTGNTFIFY